jgi:hypothetical protein
VEISRGFSRGLSGCHNGGGVAVATAVVIAATAMAAATSRGAVQLLETPFLKIFLKKKIDKKF